MQSKIWRQERIIFPLKFSNVTYCCLQLKRSDYPQPIDYCCYKNVWSTNLPIQSSPFLSLLLPVPKSPYHMFKDILALRSWASFEPGAFCYPVGVVCCARSARRQASAARTGAASLQIHLNFQMTKGICVIKNMAQQQKLCKQTKMFFP